jgi:hypothetical protein
MKFINYLTEEYAGVIKSWGTNVTVFCNPDSKEIAEMGKSDYHDIRFIIDFKNKNLFAWVGTIHKEIYDFLVKKHEIVGKGRYDSLDASNFYFFGLGQMTGKKIEYLYSHVLQTQELQKFKWLGSDLSWLLTYFTDIDFLALSKD